MTLTVACSSNSTDPSESEGSKSTTTRAPTPDQTPPKSINGITVDGDTLWVASIAGDEVLQISTSDGSILQRFDANGATPDDVDLAPDGSIWVAGFGNGDLARIHEGEYERITNIKEGLNPIAVDAKGIVWVGTYGPAGDLFRIDPSEVDPNTSYEWSPVVTGLPDINAFGILADGRIVAPSLGTDGSSSAVLIYPTSGDISELATGLPSVAAATVDSDGTPYVLANLTGEVFRIDVENKTSKSVYKVSEGAPFDNLAFGDDGTLYLSSFIAPTVTAVDPSGVVRVIKVGG